MALFTIGDLHLSLTTHKPMDIFGGAWQNYTEKILKNWNETVTDEDTVVILGDISWGISLEECREDFLFIDRLPGKKYIIKGNHDYYWTTVTKMNAFLSSIGISSMQFIFNSAVTYREGEKAVALCGTRGWIFENGQQRDDKVIGREAGRLKMSLDYIKNSDKEKIVFLHYPPVYQEQRANRIIDLMKEYNIKRCYYGHLHGRTIYYAFNKELEGIKYRLISADALNFCPYIID